MVHVYDEFLDAILKTLSGQFYGVLMSQKLAIVIGTSPGREDWLRDCLATIDRESIIVSGYGFELRKIEWVLKETNIERFVFLQDSVRIKDNVMFDILEKSEGSQCLVDDPGHFGSYIGVYERQALLNLPFPRIFAKSLSIQHEIEWTRSYLARARQCGHVLGGVGYLREEHRHGRINRVFGNEYFEKFKGDWGQIKHDNSLLDAIGHAIQQPTTSNYNPLKAASEDAIRNAILELQDLKMTIQKQKVEIDSAETKKSLFEAELLAIKSSIIWKITEPLRKFPSWLKND